MPNHTRSLSLPFPSLSTSSSTAIPTPTPTASTSTPSAQPNQRNPKSKSKSKRLSTALGLSSPFGYRSRTISSSAGSPSTPTTTAAANPPKSDSNADQTVFSGQADKEEVSKRSTSSTISLRLRRRLESGGEQPGGDNDYRSENNTTPTPTPTPGLRGISGSGRESSKGIRGMKTGLSGIVGGGGSGSGSGNGNAQKQSNSSSDGGGGGGLRAEVARGGMLRGRSEERVAMAIEREDTLIGEESTDPLLLQQQQPARSFTEEAKEGLPNPFSPANAQTLSNPILNTPPPHYNQNPNNPPISVPHLILPPEGSTSAGKITDSPSVMTPLDPVGRTMTGAGAGGSGIGIDMQIRRGSGGEGTFTPGGGLSTIREMEHDQTQTQSQMQGINQGEQRPVQTMLEQEEGGGGVNLASPGEMNDTGQFVTNEDGLAAPLGGGEISRSVSGSGSLRPTTGTRSGSGASIAQTLGGYGDQPASILQGGMYPHNHHAAGGGPTGLELDRVKSLTFTDSPADSSPASSKRPSGMFRAASGTGSGSGSKGMERTDTVMSGDLGDASSSDEGEEGEERGRMKGIKEKMGLGSRAQRVWAVKGKRGSEVGSGSGSVERDGGTPPSRRSTTSSFGSGSGASKGRGEKGKRNSLLGLGIRSKIKGIVKRHSKGEADSGSTSEEEDEQQRVDEPLDEQDEEHERQMEEITRTRSRSRTRPHKAGQSSVDSPPLDPTRYGATATQPQTTSTQTQAATVDVNGMKSPKRGILKLANDSVDPSISYSSRNSIISPSRPTSILVRSPPMSAVPSATSSPAVAINPLPGTVATSSSTGVDKYDAVNPYDMDVSVPLPTPMARFDLGSAAVGKSMSDSVTDGDGNDAVPQSASSLLGLSAARNATANTTSTSTSTPADSTHPSSMRTSSTTSTINDGDVNGDDEQATGLIMGALQRGSIDNGGPLKKSGSSSSLTGAAANSRTGGALAALGMKAMGPALNAGHEGGGGPAVLPSQPLGSRNDPLLQVTQPTPVAEKGPSGAYFGAKPEKERGRGRKGDRDSKYKKSLSPFFSRRRSSQGVALGGAGTRSRDTSPVGALSGDGESDGESITSGGMRGYRPKSTSFGSRRRSGDNAEGDDEPYSDEDSDGETDTEIEYDDATLSHEVVGEDGWVDDVFDEQTEKNTEANAAYFEGDAAGLGGTGVLQDEYGQDIEVEVDALGEGPNVIQPPEPVFSQSTMTRRPPTPPVGEGTRKSEKFAPLELVTARPEYARNRCTIRLTQGDPDKALEHAGTRLRSYVVLSDLSEEAGYALQWAIGTVARDGDELLVTTVVETDSKVDPKNPNDQDRAAKLRIQRERQGHALTLSRQATSLLQRTKLNVSVVCQAIHSKNARHMLVDLIDFLEPTMVIVGSRGLGKLQGILLGSTSHYLVQKSSVPVMVARRRLQRPLRKTDPATLRHAPRTSIASASIEKSASSKQEDDILDAEDVDREEAQAKAQGKS